MRVALTLLLVACGDAKDDDPASQETGSEAPPCDVSALDQTWPADGLSPASRDIRLTASFSGVASAEGVVFTVTDASGAAVEGSTTLTDGVATWAPAELLAEDGAYTWTVSVCDASGGGAFTTGSWGERIDPSTLVDTSFALDLSSATWVEPEGGEGIFSSLFDGVLLLGVESADETSVDLIAAIGQELEDDGTVQQDPCYATADFESSDFLNNPYASVGPTTLSLDFMGITIPIKNVYVSGAFVGGTSLVDGTMAAEVDARDAGEGMGYTGAQMCELLETYVGLSCVACTEDGEERCVTLALEDITGTLVDGLRVVPNEDPQECETDTGR